MKLIIHRGTHEIGGSCVELIDGSNRIIVDIGMPLVSPGMKDESRFDFREYKDLSGPELIEAGVLPSIRGLYSWDESDIHVDALLISHAHQDHYGFSSFLRKDIPIYASKGTIELMEISAMFLPDIKEAYSYRPLTAWQEIKIGSFIVKPHLVDHSAPDALAFEISAGGRKIFYSGDIRAHGRKEVLFDNLLARPPRKIDALLLEGTMMSRPGRQQFPNEDNIENAFLEEFTRNENIHFVFASSQNIDRFCSLYQAVKRAGATLVIDLYTAFILHRVQNISNRIPDYNSPDIRIKYWKYHADILVKNGHKSFLYKANSRKIELDELAKIDDQLVILARANTLFNKMISYIPDSSNINLILSMWQGYLTGEDPVSTFMERHKISCKYIHTSGHAITDDLARLVQAIKPRTLIPIHTFFPENYSTLSNNVTQLKDGMLFEI